MAGMVLQITEDTPEYTAMKKYENNLIKALEWDNLQYLAKRAVEYNLILDSKLLPLVKCVDPDVPTSLLAKLLLFGFYTTFKKRSSSDDTGLTMYKQWLELLSDLNSSEVTCVLVELKEYCLRLNDMIAGRASPSKEGLQLRANDISLFAKVLPIHFPGEWKDIVYSLLLTDSEIEKIVSLQSLTPDWSLRLALYMWVTKHFQGDIQAPTLSNLNKLLQNVKVSLKKQTVKLKMKDNLNRAVASLTLNLKEVVSYLCKENEEIFEKQHVPYFAIIFSSNWSKIAHSLGLREEDIEVILKDFLSPVQRLEQVLNRRIKEFGGCMTYCHLKSADGLRTQDETNRKFRDRLNDQITCIIAKFTKRVSALLKGDPLKEDDFILFADVLADYYDHWKDIIYNLLVPKANLAMVKHMMHDDAPELCLKEVLTAWIHGKFSRAQVPTLENLEKVLNANAKATLRKNLVRVGVKAENNRKLSIDRVGPSSCLKVTEGNSILFEVCTTFPEEHSKSLAYEWLFEEKYLDSEKNPLLCCFSNSYHCCNVVIAILNINSIAAEGCYKCKITEKVNNDAILLSEPIQLTIVTPLDDHKNTLATLYNFQPEVPVNKDTWPPKSGRSYINLALIKQEDIQHAGQYGRSTIRGDADDVISNKEQIIYERAFSNLESGIRLLVEGRPGSGKTTLVHKISQDWAKEKCLVFPHNRLLFLVHLRAFRSQNISLHDILKCYYSVDSTINTIIEYADKHSGFGLCFILDGLDEYNPDNSDAYVFKLIEKKVLPKSTVIIASRPAAAANFRESATRRVEVIGFLKKHIQSYIKEYPFSDASKSTELSHYLDIHPNILHMCYLPIHCAMICFLFDTLTTASALGQTETDIYKEFTVYTILRAMHRVNIGKKKHYIIKSIKDLVEPQKQIYDKICKVAFEMTVSSQQIMQQADAPYLDLEEETGHLGLVTSDEVATRYGFEKMYSFLHLTFQEFLAGYYIANLDEEYQLEMIAKYSKKEQMQQVWKFYCALAEFHDDKKFELLVNSTNYGSLYKVQCCYESQRPELCDVAVENNSLCFTGNFLSLSNFSEIAYIISNLKECTVERLSFEACSFGQEEIDMLVAKAGESIHSVKILCCYKCDMEQLHIVNYFTCHLPQLEVLDISNTPLGLNEITALTYKWRHPSLQVLKVGCRGNVLYDSQKLQQKLVSILFSQCSNFLNICFTGTGNLCFTDLEKLLPFLLLCNHPTMNISFKELNLSVVRALSCELMANPFYTKVTLLGAAIDDMSASRLCQGLKHCSNLQILQLNFNKIGDSGAESIARAVGFCSKLNNLDLSFNKIGTRGAMALAQIVRQKESLVLFLSGNDEAIENGAIDKFADFSSISLPDIGNEAARVLSLLYSSVSSMKHVIKLLLKNSKLSSASVQPLHHVLTKSSNLLVLDLSSNTLGNDSAEVLCDALQACSILNKLDLSSNCLGNAGTTTIARALKQCHFLIELKLSSNYFGNDGAKALADALTTCMLFQEFDVHSNNIGSEGAMALANAIRHWHYFYSLNINSNCVSSKGAIQLTDALKSIASFRELSIAENRILDEGACYIVENLPKLTALDISSNIISPTGIKALVSTNEHIITLNISNNALIGQDIHMLGCVLDNFSMLSTIAIGHLIKTRTPVFLNLAKVVSNNSLHIISLDISSNNLTKDTMEALLGSLKYCTRLQKLNISNTNMNITGMKCLVGSMKHLTELRVLSINSNNIGNMGADMLGCSLVHCPNLSELYLNDNNITSDGTEELTSGLGVCHSLRVLHLAHNNISGHKIAHILKVSRHLQEIDISHNQLHSSATIDVIISLQEYANISHLKLSSIRLNGKDLVRSLPYLNTVQSFHIDNNDFEAEIVREVVQKLKYCTNLKELYIGSNGIDCTTTRILASTLSQYCTELRVLDVSKNFVCSDGLNALAEVITKCLHLQELVVCNNSINSQIDIFSQSLKDGAQLHRFDISNNNLDGTGTKVLCQGLKHCRSLAYLSLGSNKLGIQGSKSVADTINHFPILYSLDLSRNEIKDTGTAALANALKFNHNLCKLLINMNCITRVGAIALAEAVLKCSNLFCLDLNHNPIGEDCAKLIRDKLKQCPDIRVANVSSYVHFHSVSTA